MEMRDIINLVEAASTNSPAFRLWFSGSVVEENGKPIVVHHGAASKFDSFDASKTLFDEDKGAFFFTDHHGTADAYITDDGHVMSVYLCLRNPLVLNADEDASAIETWDSSRGTIRDRADHEGRDGVIIWGNNGDESLFVAFHPNQIKSVDNNGEFSTDPNVYS